MTSKPPEVLYYSPNISGMKNPHGLYVSLQGIRQAMRWNPWTRTHPEQLHVWRAKSIEWEEITLD